MTVVGILDTLTEWARENICKKVLLKVPPDDETAATDAGYEYKRVNPAAFALYVPAKDKLPPSVLSPFPSVCVRFVEGSDTLAAGRRSIGIELCFSSWDPGTHGKDVLIPNREDYMEPREWSGPEAEAYFRRHGEGWRDVWNMIDIALREIEIVTNIDGILIDRSVPVKYGPLREQEAIPDYYPFWFAWVSFTVSCPITRPIQGVDELL